jgi:hypothetical protein
MYCWYGIEIFSIFLNSAQADYTGDDQSRSQNAANSGSGSTKMFWLRMAPDRQREIVGATMRWIWYTC